MIYLAQTDTTAGFLSKNLEKLNALKNRDQKQFCIITTAKFDELKKLARVPKYFKNLIRKSKKTTFIYPNLKAIRIIKDHPHEEFLKEWDWLFSTSANKHGEKFDEIWARSVADKIIDQKLFEDNASKIFKLSKKRKRKIR
ncbi:Sua5 YciO YrdC YwlC family protein [Campylobacter sp. 2018MI35]|uniref:Sua5 YciO YrdC YwlC family protein n=1 Tax=Campylobacter sp. 2018MI34 TaxID=2800582 RepID=UPI001906B6AF|nr:Sua5 YciO YrdC YwlC family protein [Campylobacter sp. 2018MI34]MBK1991475.1 Sua5 YciO YrdC YwlC family protein [Campylobacter sp. 2018MI34]